MRLYDAAMIAFISSVVATPLLTVALLKKTWRRRSWFGLKASLLILVASLGVGIATSPPKAVLEAEARERAARLEQAASERAAKAAAEAEATRMADAEKAKQQEIARERAAKIERDAEQQRETAAVIERERQRRETAERQVAEASARAARHKQLEAEAIEATRAARATAEARAAGANASPNGPREQVLGPKPLLRDLIGCKDREAYARLAKIAASGDQAALVKLGTSLVMSGTCRSLNAGTLVHLEDTAIFSALMCARPAGDVSCYWMAIDATK